MAASDISHPSKKQRTEDPKVRVLYQREAPLTLALKAIGTHNGTFHCDEALAVYMLRLTEAYRNAGYSFYTIDVACALLKL